MYLCEAMLQVKGQRVKCMNIGTAVDFSKTWNHSGLQKLFSENKHYSNYIKYSRAIYVS